jgi:toxin ParE1/3/4
MAHRVVWSARALADVDAIASYIAADSSSYAGTVVRKILSLTQTLAAFPLAGRKVPEFDDIVSASCSLTVTGLSIA